MGQLMHVLVQIIDPSPLSQLQQALLQVSKDPLLQQYRFSRIQLQNQSVVACQRLILVLLIGGYDDDSPGVVVDL